MGVVYQAFDPKLRRKVAIKTILISQFDEETKKDFSMRFEREAEAAARLTHPNIVQVYDFGEQAGVAYLVMEFIDGKELKLGLATSSTFDRKESVRIMCELLDALAFAHENRVVHRDVKPANVMLDTQGRVKLADFGVARMTDADRTHAERTQTVVGTPAYMSPEQIQGHRVDGRTDIFSAGIILYQLLTGKRPFTGEGTWTIQKQIIQDEPPTPSSLNVAVSPELDRVVAKALAKRPEDRYSTAREFAQALRNAAEGKAGDPAIDPTVIVPRETETPPALRSGEMELEFWRSIKDGDDPNDFEAYLRQFPKGVYASLAGRRVARLRGLPVEGGSEASDTRQPARREATGSQGRLARGGPEPTEKRRAESSAVEKTLKLSRTPAPDSESETEARHTPGEKRSSILIPAVLGLLAAAGVAAYFGMRPGMQAPAPAAPGVEATGKVNEQAEAQAKREAAAQAQREAEEKARSEAELQAKQKAELQVRREGEAKAQREAELKAQREQAQREADSRTRAEAELRAQREAETKTQQEAKEKARLDAQLKEKREGALRAQREAEAAKREADRQAKREAEVAAKREADKRTQLAAEETALWNSARRGNNAAEFQKYLSRYPNGRYAEDARKQLAAIESARLDEEKQSRAREAEAARKRQSAADKRKSTIVVPPTF